MRRLRFQVLIAIFASLIGFSNDMNAQTDTNKNQTLSAKQQSIVTISAFTAKGDLEKLRTALNGGLDSGLTVNEIIEKNISKEQAETARRSLAKVNTATRKKQ